MLSRLERARRALQLGRLDDASGEISDARGLLRGASGLMYRKLINPIADMSMLAHIETIRLTGGETANIRDASPFPKNYGQSLFTTDVLYQKAFRNDGIDLGAEDPQAVAGQIKARAIVRELVVALDHWAQTTSDPARAKRLVQIADLLDSEPGSKSGRLRRAFATSDKNTLLESARTLPVADQETSTLFLLATALRNCGEVEEASRLFGRCPAGPAAGLLDQPGAGQNHSAQAKGRAARCAAVLRGSARYQRRQP